MGIHPFFDFLTSVDGAVVPEYAEASRSMEPEKLSQKLDGVIGVEV